MVDEAEDEWPKVQCEDCYREFDYALMRVFQGAAREFLLCPACHRKYSEQRERAQNHTRP